MSDVLDEIPLSELKNILGMMSVDSMRNILKNNNFSTGLFLGGIWR